MPFRIRVAAAVIIWLVAMFFVLLIWKRVMTLDVLELLDKQLRKDNPVMSLGAIVVVCLIELVLTSATDGESRGGTVFCSGLLVAFCAVVFLYDFGGPWFLCVTATGLFWNLLLLKQATQKLNGSRRAQKAG